MSLYLVRSGDLCRVARADTPVAAAVIALADERAIDHEGKGFALGLIATMHLIPEPVIDYTSVDLNADDDSNHVIHITRLFEAAGFDIREGV